MKAELTKKLNNEIAKVNADDEPVVDDEDDDEKPDDEVKTPFQLKITLKI